MNLALPYLVRHRRGSPGVHDLLLRADFGGAYLLWLILLAPDLGLWFSGRLRYRLELRALVHFRYKVDMVDLGLQGLENACLYGFLVF